MSRQDYFFPASGSNLLQHQNARSTGTPPKPSEREQHSMCVSAWRESDTKQVTALQCKCTMYPVQVLKTTQNATNNSNT